MNCRPTIQLLRRRSQTPTSFGCSRSSDNGSEDGVPNIQPRMPEDVQAVAADNRAVGIQAVSLPAVGNWEAAHRVVAGRGDDLAVAQREVAPLVVACQFLVAEFLAVACRSQEVELPGDALREDGCLCPVACRELVAYLCPVAAFRVPVGFRSKAVGFARNHLRHPRPAVCRGELMVDRDLKSC